MKIGLLVLTTSLLFFLMLHSKVAMAQQASLKIQLGAFISVNCIPDPKYFSPDEVKDSMRDSLFVAALGAFELRVGKEGIDRKRSFDIEEVENRNFLFLSSPSMPSKMRFNVIRGQGEIKFPLGDQVKDTFVSITAL